MFKMCIGIRNLLKHMDTRLFFINCLLLNKDKMKKHRKEAWVSVYKGSMGSIGTYHCLVVQPNLDAPVFASVLADRLNIQTAG